MSTPHILKQKLLKSIAEIDIQKESFVQNPGKDFTRNRKITFSDILKLTLHFEKHSIRGEISSFYEDESKLPSRAAFVQQRDKVSYEAFTNLFHTFMNKVALPEKFNNYRLLACDGTQFNLPRNLNDTQTLIHTKPNAKPYNAIHLNALYDIMNHVYTDFDFDYANHVHEAAALYTMAERLKNKQKTILIADRGYGYFNVFEHLNRLNVNYVVRVKDITSKTSLVKSFDFPDTEFDTVVNTCLTYRNFKDMSNYHKIPKEGFDFFTDDVVSLPISFRIVRFRLPGGDYETLITNLSKESFSTTKIIHMYHMRWGIETAFRTLKYTLSLVYLHSKKINAILSEIVASIVMQNYIFLTVNCKQKELNASKKTGFKINFSNALIVCRDFLLNKRERLDELLKDPVPERPNRRFHRYLHDTKPAKAFTYR